jgi:uncharacterized protein YbbC (DUF1343 family)
LLLACENSEQKDPQQVNPPDSDSLAEAPPSEPLRPIRVRTGAERLLGDSLELLFGQRVAVVANHTSLVGETHLVDTLLARGVEVVQVFAPEHGFRGQADAGQRVRSSIDPKTGLPIVSLYGNNKKPQPGQLAEVDLVVFDIQDVGTRFYTYLSTLTYVMEACAEQGKAFMVLDRPNPNGWYVDGPVLEPENRSFIGLHPIPVVHGMTLGEYARLLNGEGWLADGIQAELQVIPCEKYRHDLRWEETGLPWIAPSPNLASAYAAYLYPALCWFEPTPVSVGRGTDSAFTLVGAPWYQPPPNVRMADVWEAHGLQGQITHFMPVSLPGKATYPKFQDQSCRGIDFQNRVEGKALFLAGLTLLAEMYQLHQVQQPGARFFQANFERWPGTRDLARQIEAGLDTEAIYQEWQPAVEAFRRKRARYLLYP